MIASRSGRLRRSPARRAGLSLLEVLLALAIFLIALAAIGSLVNFGNEQSIATSMEVTGARLAQRQLAEVEAGSIPASTGGSGTFDDEPDWNWSVEASTAVAPNTFPVTIRVWREAGGRRYEVVLNTVVFDPAQMGTAAEAKPPTTTGTTGTTGATGSGTTTGGM